MGHPQCYIKTEHNLRKLGTVYILTGIHTYIHVYHEVSPAISYLGWWFQALLGEITRHNERFRCFEL